MDISSLYSIFLRNPVISTDTRNIKPGCIFFALKGAQFDGNTFAMEALNQGAAYAVVSDPALAASNILIVEDTLQTLQTLARYHRRQLAIPVLGITGSNGKTTTKELINAVLARKYKVHATTGNLNNHIGVPLTLLGTPPDAQVIVCEMGANHVGEIAFLCSLAEPTHGIITNIGKAHLEGFGSVDGVKRAKGELFDYIRNHKGFAFVNADDPLVRDLGESLIDKITYGFEPAVHPDILFSYSDTRDEGGFTIKDLSSNLVIRSSMFGQYNATNMLAAYAIGCYFDVSMEQIVNGLTEFIPGSNRSELMNYNGCIVIKDAYNANPTSMELAVRAFSERFPNGWIVLGDMKELGENSFEAHHQMIDLITTMAFERIYIIGEAFKKAYNVRASNDSRILTARNIEQLKEKWNWEQCTGKALLLKGSRSMHLEYLLDQ